MEPVYHDSAFEKQLGSLDFAHKFHDAVQDGLGPRRTARDEHLDGYHVLNALTHVVTTKTPPAAMQAPTAITRLGSGDLFVNSPQSVPSSARYSSSNNENICESWAENHHASISLHIIAGRHASYEFGVASVT